MLITQALTAVALTVAASVVFPLASQAQSKVTAEEAHAIGVDAYLYLYPLLTMDITRKQFTNIEPGKEFGKGPMNMFVSVPQYPPADFKGVVRSNFDTLYSIAWLDLTEEPLVIAAPDTAGRFYLLPMLDMWTDVFASPGWRTTGTQAGQFLVTPPGWTGTVPAGLNHLPAPTPIVWVIGRTKTDGAADYAAVHKIQAGYTVTPLSRLGKSAEPVSVNIDPAVDMKTPPKIQVDSMSAADYFAYAAELLKVHPAHISDQPILAQMKRIGIEPGKSFDMKALDPEIQAALQTVPKDAQALMTWKVPTLARVVNGWSMNTDTMGVYGNYYLKRAIVAQIGLGANLPEDAIYPLNIGDVEGKPLDGSNKYVLHFEKGETPPVNAFWSITLYDPEGFQVGNALNRFAVSSWMPFKTNADGSLDIYLQHENPGKDLEANWLPAPKGGFNLTMRLYGPKPEVLNGKWNPPPVKPT
ncbi:MULTISPECIES: DUF1254 domain-containing protein [unclassified Pseudomonas]|uniref:DUF1254 domain-containing protein n=1 Tax=unclassified Pseudomonas TaxID=196821 RepID=UPI000C878CA2|nr:MULTISPECIES: DUF1254 domain-containing protein [unclassified Pseudomonas]PMU08529.1 hypothetical protein C1Y11_21645 [Pseudomonas sp. FW305-20]PMU19298.1 hypothetical protein C1Y10_10495 [Pseudomonas sp. FW305-122]PMU36460.1 hypothetical protein C1Y12_22320 [Pseudomonas sp. FW305-47B]PMX60915.1 hypothetical protein C1Y13_13700 [Pseudomonas sp. FW305-33]PMX65857.1 hypothetical protein C1X12_18870 [Pseudomonas sp. FW305-60]